MILKNFYTEKKAAITDNLTNVANVVPRVHLYSDSVFNETITTTIIMFKYDAIDWQSSSEKTYKADVNFSIYVVLPKANTNWNNYEEAFEIAAKIDKAILSKPTIGSIHSSHSTFKVHEKQVLNSNANYWNKSDYFIWEIAYKTTLVENVLKKKYTLITNGTTADAIEDLGYTASDLLGTENKNITVDFKKEDFL